MALVKMTRAVPEVAGGKTSCEIPEDAVKAAIENGWTVAKETSKDTSNEVAKKEEKVEATAAETVKEEAKEPSKTTAKSKKLRDE